MKKAIKIKELPRIPKQAFNQWVKLLLDKDFLTLVDEQITILVKLPNEKPTFSFSANCHRQIKSYLTKRNIPVVWKEPIYNKIIGKIFPDYPLHNSISLKVGCEEITSATENLLKIKNIKTGEFMDDKTISLVISSKVSAEQIIQFIKDNKRDIEQLQDFYELPEYINPVWKNTSLALDIIEMRDKGGLSFPEISSKLSDNESLSDDEIECLTDENNVKNLYYRFKKYLGS